MRFKKGILLLSVLGMVSVANAYDYSSLTKATVKLIETNREHKSSIEEHKQILDNYKDELKTTNKNFSELKSDFKDQSKRFNTLKRDTSSSLDNMSKKILSVDTERIKNTKSINQLERDKASLATKLDLQESEKNMEHKLNNQKKKLESLILKHNSLQDKTNKSSINKKVNKVDFVKMEKRIIFLESQVTALKTKNNELQKSNLMYSKKINKLSEDKTKEIKSMKATLEAKSKMVLKVLEDKKDKDIKKLSKELSDYKIKTDSELNKYKNYVAKELILLKNSLKLSQKGLSERIKKVDSNVNKLSSKKPEIKEVYLEKEVEVSPSIESKEKLSIKKQKDLIDSFNQR
jgi:chromosome segregation ATPase